jgi:hypothetical protein
MSKREWVRRALEESLHREASAPDPVARLAKLNAPTADIEQMLAETIGPSAKGAGGGKTNE